MSKTTDNVPGPEETPEKIEQDLKEAKGQEKKPVPEVPAPQHVKDASSISADLLPDGLRTVNLNVRETLDVARSGKGLSSQAEAFRLMASFIDYLLLAGRFSADDEKEIHRRVAEMKEHL